MNRPLPSLMAVSVSYSWRSFAQACAVFILPSAVIGALVVLLAGSHYKATDLPDFRLPVPAMFITLALIAPAVETLMLIIPTVLTAKVLRSHWLICVVGAVPLSLLHAVGNDWLRCVIVLWSFVWSGHCYLRLRARQESFGRRYLFVFGMHALNNGLVVLSLPFL
jgi:hypothetical protein